jgi:hypothetical protein
MPPTSVKARASARERGTEGLCRACAIPNTHNTNETHTTNTYILTRTHYEHTIRNTHTNDTTTPAPTPPTPQGARNRRRTTHTYLPTVDY